MPTVPTFPRALLPTFIPTLNALLAALALPFSIDHPTDLTPSLLLAIFESLIAARLPIPQSVRHSRTKDAKARAMLILLGVLECDVLRGGTAANDGDPERSIADDSALGAAGGVSVDGWVDEIGLGEVDPERLADGGWEETIFVGELLCWLARRRGILPRIRSSRRPSHARSLYSHHHSYGTEDEGEASAVDFSTSLLLRPSSAQRSSSAHPRSIGDVDADFSALSITDVPRHPLVHSPEPSLSTSATTGTDLSIRARSISSRTSVSNAHDDPDEEASQDTLHIYDPVRMMQDADEDDDQPPSFHAHCIHELEDPSYIRALAGPSSSFGDSLSHDLASDEDADGHDDDLYAPPTPTPRRVRLTGWIDSVDSATELSHFAAARSRSRVFDTSAGSGPPVPQHSYKHTRSGEFSASRQQPDMSSRPGSGKSRTRHPSYPPSPSPSPPPATTSKLTSAFLPPSPPLSPPSPTAHSDPPFDISFSTLNNTSTPAKPRRLQSQTTAEARIGVSTGTTEQPLSRRRDRSPSYTPSPPSYSTPGSLSKKADPAVPSGTKTRHTPSGSSTPGSTSRSQNGSTVSPVTSAKGKSPPGSTTTTNTLLNERARLLTELAALKRVRAASGAGTKTGVVGRRVGVGV